MGRNDDASRRVSGPPPPDHAVAELAARQDGVAALGQLLALGLKPRAVQRRAERGLLHRWYPGVYAVGHTRLTRWGRWWAAVLYAGPGAVLSHRDAAAAWGLRPPPRRPLIDVTTARRGRSGRRPSPGRPGIDVHRTRDLRPEDVTELDGLPITTVARTLVDLAGVVDGDAVERALDKAEILRLLDRREIEDALAHANGRRGTGVLRSALAQPRAGPARSVLEERFLTLCRGGGLPLPRLNAHVQAGGRLVEVDALWPDVRLVVELDGADVHGTRRAFHADRRRDAALAAEGFLVVRLTWQRVTRDRIGVLDELRRIRATRGGRV